MNKKLKSLLAVSLSATMLFTACGEKEEKSVEKEKEDKVSSSLSDITNFDFKGLNNAISYAENAVTQVEDALEGKVDTGVTTEITFSFGELMRNEMDFDIKDFKLSNSAKVKEGIVANDLSIFYDNNSLVTLNAVVDDKTVYFRVPEISDGYIKGNLDDLEIPVSSIGSSSKTAVNPVYMVANPSVMMSGAGNYDAIADALENLDEEVLSNIMEEIMDIIVKHIPEGKDGEKVSGDINGLKYDYSTKIHTITSKNAYDAVMDILAYAKDNEEIAGVYDSLFSATKQEMINSGYYTEEEVNEIYPDFDKLISDAIAAFEKEKEDAYNSEETAEITVYYDGNEAVGFAFSAEDSTIEVVMIDEVDKLGLKVSADDSEYVEMAFSIEGMDGKYDAKFAVTIDEEDDDYDSYVEIGFTSDVDVVDEQSGAFKGTIEFYAKGDDFDASLVLTSNSTAKDTDIKIETFVDGKSVFTIGLTNVTTNASDVTVPSGKVYDVANESDMEEFSANADLEGFQAHIKSVLGDELYTAMFESNDDDYDDYYDDYDDYYDEYDYDFDYAS